jgi:hypothetical protein
VSSFDNKDRLLKHLPSGVEKNIPNHDRRSVSFVIQTKKLHTTLDDSRDIEIGKALHPITPETFI